MAVNYGSVQKQRLSQLDGLRGLAILMVFFTHARLSPLFANASPFVKTLLSILTNNGGIGVSILFLLSGYLMMSIYPIVPKVMTFWQKRYTRIFPAFLTMTIVLAITRSFWQQFSWLLIIMIALSIIRISGFIWQKVRLSPKRLEIGKLLFKSFLLMQLFAVIGYIVLQNIVPPAVFMQLWPKWSQFLIAWLVNATMSLPFGNYIGQLDGVYWSICTEVLFYLLYPRIFLPLFNLVTSKKSWFLNIISLIFAGIFFYGLDLVNKNVLGLGLLQLRLAIFFILGMAVGRLQTSSLSSILSEKLKKLGIFLSIFTAIITLAAPIIFSFLAIPSGVETILWSMPLASMLFFTLTIQNAWSKFLQSKFLILLGTVSYAIYLTHTIVLEIFTKNGEPKTVFQSILILIISIIVTGLLAAVVHVYLEKPYLFDKIKETNKPKVNIQKTSNIIFLVLMIIVTYLSLIWVAYRIPTSLLANVVNHKSNDLPKINLIKNESSIVLPFTATQNNLGMLFINLKPLSSAQSTQLGVKEFGGETLAALHTIIRSEGQIISQTDFPIYQIYDADFFMIGIPMQNNSANKKYQLELSINTSNANKNLALINGNFILRSVYFQSRKYYLENPLVLMKLILVKIIQPFDDSEAQVALIFALPLILTLLVISSSRKHLS